MRCREAEWQGRKQGRDVSIKQFSIRMYNPILHSRSGCFYAPAYTEKENSLDANFEVGETLPLFLRNAPVFIGVEIYIKLSFHVIHV